jgi:hypothetical protein
MGMARSHTACGLQPAAHSSARSAQCAVAHSTASAKRRANKKAKEAHVSISYVRVKKRHYVQHINCNRSNQLQQIGCKTDQSKTGGAHRHS